jgi:NAD+ kinase
MNCVGIVPNIDKDANFTFTKKIIEYVKKLDGTVLLSNTVSKLACMEFLGVDGDTFYKTVDFIIVLGGDGTMLRASQSAALYNKPLLGINLGTLGYLTDVEKYDAMSSIEKVFKGDYKLEKRMMLEATFVDKNKNKKTYIALNDICITKPFNKLLSLDITINDEFIDTYRADGVIISTPSGSTAYNLSAGGSIIKPDIEVIAITPICPQMASIRPYIVSANDVIKIDIVDKNLGNTIFSLDGEHCETFDYVFDTTLKKSNFYTTIIKTNNLTFHDIMKRKLMF